MDGLACADRGDGTPSAEESARRPLHSAAPLCAYPFCRHAASRAVCAAPTLVSRVPVALRPDGAPQAWIRLWEAPCRRAGRSGRCIRKMESEACANGRLLPRKMASEACADGRPRPGRAGASPVGTRQAGDQQLQVLRSREEGRHNEEGAIPPLNTPQCRRDAQQYPVYRPASPRRRKGAGSARQASAPVCRAHATFTQ